MNIISGKLHGMKLAVPKDQGTRPTAARVREAVFNILAPELEESVFWDLFAGSGAMGLTALSLGARECVLVESSRPALVALQKNVAEAMRRLGESEQRLRVVSLGLAKAWEQVKKGSPPDLIWADPPYSDSMVWADFLKRELAAIGNKRCFLVMEVQSKALQGADERFFLDEYWETVKTRKYGGTSIIIWRKKDERPTP